MSNRVLVVGSSGFIGSNLAKGFRYKSWEVVTASHRRPNKHAYTHTYTYTMSDPLWLERLVRATEPKVVIFAFSIAHHVESVFQARLREFSNALSRATNSLQQLSQVVYFGSASEYGRSQTSFTEKNPTNPIDDYGRRKLAETKLFSELQTGIKSLVLRPTSVYGQHQRGPMFTPSLLNAIGNERVFRVERPSAKRDFLYIDDLVSAVISCVESNMADSKILNVSSGISVSLWEYTEIIKTLFHVRDSLIQRAEGELNEIGVDDCLLLDSSLLRDKTGWSPAYDIYSGLRKLAYATKMDR